jgi:hypothetical protein
MDSPSPLALHPALLPPGTRVGAWRVQALAGHGSYGAVYRAVPWRNERSSPVALKVALHVEDPRFAREVVLLARSEHPSIPRLVDHGCWQSASGTLHPFLVMSWVDGEPLYEQARLHPPAPARVRLWLAQLAQALAVLHAQDAVHRDLKGDNVLVRRCDDRAMLMDLGTGLYPGAVALTPAMGFPGTPLYRSPEAWLFEIQFHGSSTELYRPTAADDLYSLGVTACRLLTGEYPELWEPYRDEHGTWRLKGVRLPRALRNKLVVEPSLRSVILRLLSVNPEQRGTAAQLAEVLERAAPSQPQRARSPAPARPRWPWLAMAAGLALMVGAGWTVAEWFEEKASLAQARTEAARRQAAGTAGLGEAASTASTAQSLEPSVHAPLAEDTLPEPLPGQVRPDAKGRCPHKRQVVLNGACWVPMDPEECDALGPTHNGKLFKGRCYVPVQSPDRPSTSHPTRTP